MAVQPTTDQELDEPEAVRMPRPVPGGSVHLESLGRFIDNLMGSARAQRETEVALEPFLLSEDEMPEDPVPSEPPPPVEDGSEAISKGADPVEQK